MPVSRVKAELAQAIRAKVETFDRLLDLLESAPGVETKLLVNDILAQEQHHLEALCSSLTEMSLRELNNASIPATPLAVPLGEFQHMLESAVAPAVVVRSVHPVAAEEPPQTATPTGWPSYQLGMALKARGKH